MTCKSLPATQNNRCPERVCWRAAFPGKVEETIRLLRSPERPSPRLTLSGVRAAGVDSTPTPGCRLRSDCSWEHSGHQLREVTL